MEVRIEPGWKVALQQNFKSPYFKQLTDFVRQEYQTNQVYPPAKLIFNAFDRCPLEQVKVVILGQDPYHGHGQANGLCFSVSSGVPKPPSLVNIFKELENDLAISPPETGNLERWAEQGVLLLNATLTVRSGQAGSHQGKGWEHFTDQVIKVLSDQKKHLVFILWGSYAQKKGAVINSQQHLVIRSPHPSPLSAHRGFFGSKPFSKANNFLQKNGESPINW